MLSEDITNQHNLLMNMYVKYIFSHRDASLYDALWVALSNFRKALSLTVWGAGRSTDEPVFRGYCDAYFDELQFANGLEAMLEADRKED